MSFLGRLKKDAIPADTPKPAKVAPTAQGPSALDKHLADLTGPTRPDGSDKFFGFENYSSTCYCNSILQALYYSEPFRNNVINFPPSPHTNGTSTSDQDSSHTKRSALSTRPPPSQPGPLAANSPARRPIVLPGSQAAQNTKPDEKDSPEWKKKQLMQSALMLDMQLNYADTYGMQESLFTALKDIFEAIISQDTRTGIVSPHKLLEILRKENEMFRSAMHQDAHEFLGLLLNQVADTVDLYQKQQGDQKGLAATKQANAMALPTALTKAATGWVHELFEGLLVSETRCLTCENVSQRDEAFMDLSVDLTAHSSVTSCLRKFSAEEMLCERNKFHCDGCGGLQEAEKRMKIKRLPRVLALHLKRFEYSEDYSRLQKLFHRVAYPFHLRLFNTTEDALNQDRLYELYAVVVHIGGGPYHGHYVSIIKTQDRGWLLFDDELVEPVSKSYVQSFFGGEPKTGVQDAKQLSCAYVLFYQETTEEAIQKEMEADAAAATAAAMAALRVNDATSPVSPAITSSNPWTNGLKARQGITTPTEEKDEPFANLSHAITAPSAPSSFQPLAASSTVPNLPSTASGLKTRKDLKREEKLASKERKAAEKEAERLAKEARAQRTKDRLDFRNVLARRQEEEFQQALEASRLTKADEDIRAGLSPTEEAHRDTGDTHTAAGPNAAPGAEVERTQTNTSASTAGMASPNLNSADRSGFGARLRHSSLSLRQKKPAFWKKDTASTTTPAASSTARSAQHDSYPPAAQQQRSSGGGAGTHLALDEGEASTRLLGDHRNSAIEDDDDDHDAEANPDRAREKEESGFGSASPIVGHNAAAGSPALNSGFGWKLGLTKSASSAITGAGDGDKEKDVGKERRSHRFSMGRKRSAVFSS